MATQAVSPPTTAPAPPARPNAFWSDLSDRFLRHAGLRRGMRVLDVGTGVGDLAILAARLVGPTGYVVGIDRDPTALAVARRRVDGAGLPHVELRLADLLAFADTLRPDLGAFDAVIGRFVLDRIADPVAALREIASLARPGGVVAFQEYDFTAAIAADAVWPPVPSFIAALDRMVHALDASGADTTIGCKLRRYFESAGLPEPLVTASAYIQGGPDSTMYDMIADVTRSLLPAIERAGLGTAAEIDVDTLAARLRAAMTAADASARSPDLVAAWCTLPSR
ncbi:methyltransferase type 11 [Gemmatirosa kalamazoonensis]|uniref:Methyltransferase type 11 n=1 Tax=Gemmatirosa kalamazoonensis TaxID=861299 RepID=W0RKB7_9BACT|nr:class I SAM-dependent methyltransferase [Gemmatirosa kalamazoonensis]AHG91191.1 methyltransferase type 11 [Gemmatirosa kalamazoonensis]